MALTQRQRPANPMNTRDITIVSEF